MIVEDVAAVDEAAPFELLLAWAINTSFRNFISWNHFIRFLPVHRQLNRWPCPLFGWSGTTNNTTDDRLCSTEWPQSLVTFETFWDLCGIMNCVRGCALTIAAHDNPGELGHLRHWLKFWQLIIWIHGNLCLPNNQKRQWTAFTILAMFGCYAGYNFPLTCPSAVILSSSSLLSLFNASTFSFVSLAYNHRI